jgi:hypothetical protein
MRVLPAPMHRLPVELALEVMGGPAPADVAVGMNPADVPWMRSVWDAYEGATWDGSNLLATIADTGPDGNDMAPDVVGLPQDPYIVGADTAAVLPGTSTNWQHTPEAPLNETVTAFTMFAIIPAQVKPSANRVYAAMLTDSAGGYFALQIAGSVTPGAVNIVTPAGTQATVQLGLGAAGVQDGAHAILGIRRSGTVMVIDVWYDLKDGNGLHGPTRTVVASTMAASVMCKGFALGGRAAITQYWNGSPIHLLAWADGFIPDAYMEAMAAWAGDRLDMAIDEPVFTETPGAKYNGGKELHDGTGHLPRDAGGFYLARTTGTRLVIDAGYSAGDAVGAPRVYGLPSAAVVGTPATGRRSGFDALSDSDYFRFSPSASAVDFSAFVAGNKPDPFKTVIGSDAAAGDDRVVFRTGAGSDVGILATDATINDTAAVASLLSAGSAGQFTWGTKQSTGEKDVAAWWGGTKRGAGAESLPTVNPDVSGETWWFGRNQISGQTWGSNGTVDVVVFAEAYWDPTDQDAAYAAWVADNDPDAMLAALGATWASDGLICGAYDPAAPAELFTLSGSGADVTVST